MSTIILRHFLYLVYLCQYHLTDIKSSYKINRKNDKAVKIMIKTQFLLLKAIGGNRRLRVWVRVSPADTKVYFRRRKTSSQVACKTPYFRPVLKGFSGLRKAPVSRL